MLFRSWTTPTPVGIPKTGFPTEQMAHVAAANIAAQIANPQDLLRPRDMTPADAQRRATVLGKYRAGEVTSSARDDQAAGAISRAIN